MALLLEYEGTEYCGFQLQARGSTVQGELERAIERLTGEQARVVAASRTDAGTHALGQVVAFRTGSRLPAAAFVRGLNYYLPEAIVVRAAVPVADGFNPRRQAVSREYRYTIIDGAAPSPFWRRYAWWLPTPLDQDAMTAASRALLGERDMAAFAPSSAANTVRTVHRADWRGKSRTLTFTIVANSFLPQQVRRIVGSLAKVGQGKATPAEFQALVSSGRPGQAESAAPARGLCLVRVNFREDLFVDQDV